MPLHQGSSNRAQTLLQEAYGIYNRRQNTERPTLSYPEHRGGWYDAPRLHLLITGQDFVVPYGWDHFSELLGLFILYTRHPEALAHGHHGDHVMFSPPGNASKDGFFGLDGLRIFLPPDDFETLVRELVARCSDGVLADALDGLRSLYGDL
jgi:hypothetical protein